MYRREIEVSVPLRGLWFEIRKRMQRIEIGTLNVSVPLRGLWFEILVLGSLISCGFAVRFAARICFLPIFYVA